MKAPTYQDVFKSRAQAHVDAFRMYPQACQIEIETCLSFANLQPGEVLLDMPSAGGFLSAYVSVKDVHVIAVDPSPELHAFCAQLVSDSRLAPMDCLPLSDASIDAAICLAGLHHEPNIGAVFAEIRRVIKPEVGRLVIAEVDTGSDAARFLNGFVHNNSSNGHVGSFVDDEFVSALVESGLTIERNEVATYYWLFDSRFALGDCLQRMFGIDLATPDEIIQAVSDILGIDELPDGRIGMKWSLRFFLARCH